MSNVWQKHDAEAGRRQWRLWLTQPLSTRGKLICWGVCLVLSLAAWTVMIGLARLMWFAYGR